MKYISSLFIVLCLSFCLSAQNTAPGLWLENLEELAEEGEDLAWDEDDLEELDFRLHTPLDLNSVTRHQLEQLPFLSEGQVENILAYIYIHGPMKSLYELQLVEGMDRRTIGLLQPFVRVDTVYGGRPKHFPALRNVWRYGKHEVLGRFDVPFYRRKGYTEGDYLGPALYHSLRYSFRYGDYLQAGVTGEKDAGEPWFALHDRKGYDHYSYYLLLRHLGRLEALAVGTYRLDYGQGLVLGNSFGLGKSFSLATSRYREGGIRKHGSTDEYNYFRGVAAQARLAKNVHASAFYSHRRMDGTVEDGHIVSIYKTGLHRTQAEAGKMHAFTLQMAGGNLTYENTLLPLRVGLTGIYYFFDRPYRPNLRTYAKYNLQGNRFYNLGLNYRYRLGSFGLTGEAALGKHGYALLNRLEYDLSTETRLMLVHRLYTHDYWALFAHAFAEGSAPQNENGWYLAAETQPWAHWRLFASLDFFSFPWWRYRISKPSQGWEGRFQATWMPGETFSMYANYRYKRRDRDVTGTGGEVILPTHHHKARCRADWHPAAAWRLCTTVDYNHFHSQGLRGSQGWQCTQLCSYTLPWFPFAVSVQGTYFHTDDYDARVFAYEPGLLYTFYTPSFSGHGFRLSVRLRYDLGEALMLMAKLGQTLYCDREEISSGRDLIAANKKMDLQVQLRMKF